MIGLSPALDLWNGGADLATRSARFSSLGGGNTEYILIPGGKLPDSTDDQKRHAKHREGKPAKKHEAPMERSNGQFFHDPNSAPPFVESRAWQKHERPDEQENIGGRPAMAGKGRQACPSIQQAADARDDVDWIGDIVLDDVHRCEGGIADKRLIPGCLLFAEVAGAPIKSDTVKQNPPEQVENPAQFFTRLDFCHVEVPRPK